MHEGRSGVPWVLSAELDGQSEEWLPWVGLPLRTRVAPLQGSDDPLAGNGQAGPLESRSLDAQARRFFGGEEVWILRPSALATDTPSTRLHFWRGAVNSYRFGFGLSRAVLGPWSLDLRMNTRSAPGREWEYRQQVNDMFGPRGNPAGLPYKGQGPGQDDSRWNATVSRSLEGGRLDLGWFWSDNNRGVPDPLSSWDSLLPKDPAYTTSSGLFGRVLVERDAWDLVAATRSEAQRWSLPSWTDTGSTSTAVADYDILHADARLGMGSAERRLFLEGTWEALEGVASVVRAPGPQFADIADTRVRGGVSGIWILGVFQLGGGGGWTSLSSDSGQELSGIDTRADLRMGSEATHLRAVWARSVVLPGFESTLRPDVARPRLDTTGLAAETRDRLELRGRLEIGPLSATAGGALIQITDALRPLLLPAEGAPAFADRAIALRSRNRADVVQGFSLESGLAARWSTLEASTRLGFGHTGLPGESFGGRRDQSEAQWRTRSSLRWSAELLPGRFRATSTMALSTWSASRLYVPYGHDQATLLDLPGSWNLDWENRCEIRSFELFWRLENLGHQRHAVLPGWTPPGIRSGWGVVWNFGG
jgi:hypothetical protein